MANRFQSSLSQIKEDQETLFQVSELLLSFFALKGSGWKEDKESLKDRSKRAKQGEGDINHLSEEINLLYNLNRLPLKIRSGCYKNLAVRITKFALDDLFRTEENLYYLTDDIHKALNKKMVATYKKDITDIKSKILNLLRSEREIKSDQWNKLRRL